MAFSQIILTIFLPFFAILTLQIIMIFLALYHKNRKQEITNVFMTKADDDARKNTFSVIFSTAVLLLLKQQLLVSLLILSLTSLSFFTTLCSKRL